MTRRSEPKAGRLFQEDLLDNPFWMLVACSLVNRTTWDQAKPAFTFLRENYATVEELSRADPVDLEDALRPLGLWRQRSRRIPFLAQCWVLKKPTDAEDVLDFPGCGRYASDSWAIFIEGRTDIEPTDGKLNWHLHKLRQGRLTMAKAARKTKQITGTTTVTEIIKAVEVEKVVPIQVETAQEPILMTIRTEVEIMAEVAQMPPIHNTKCIKDVSCQLLTAVRVEDRNDPYTLHGGTTAHRVVGFSYASILKKISIMFPNSITSNACLRWYMVRIRQEVEGFDKYKMPIKFKRPKSML